LGREHFKHRIIAKEKGKQIYLNKQTNKQEMGMSQLWPCSVYISKYIKKKRRRIMKIQIFDHSKHIISPKNKTNPLQENQNPSRLS
jgi:hypothetical protein